MNDNSQQGSFEQRVKRLEAIVKELEVGSASLEEALCLFEEGIALARALKEQLDGTERRIEQILEEGTLRPLEVEMDDET